MNKAVFLSTLREKLSGLPKEDIERTVAYYSESIDDRMEDGLSEEAAVADVGSPSEIAFQILTEAGLPKQVSPKPKPGRGLRAWEIVLLILGFPLWFPLTVAAFSVALALYITLLAVILSLYAVVFSLGVGAVACVIGAAVCIPAGGTAQGILYLGTGLVCGGVTILLFLGGNLLIKGVFYLSKKLVHGIAGCFRRKEDAQ